MLLKRFWAVLAVVAACLTGCSSSNTAFADTFGDAESVVYFVRYENTDFGNSPLDLYALSLPSQQERQITFGAKVRYVALSPDGQSLAYLDAKADRTAPIEMMRSNLDGTNTSVIGETSSTGLLHWSPDGKSIFHGRQVDGTEVVSSINVETGESRVLVSPSLRAAHPIGVVDNSLIYIDLDQFDQRFVRFDLKTEQIVDSVDFDRPRFQQIRPDGTAMIVGTLDGELFEIDLTEPGMALTKLGLTNSDPRELFVSPDGEHYGFVGRRDLLIATSSDPTDLFEVRRSRRTDNLPLWTPDSQSIVFAGSNDLWDRTIHVASPEPWFEGDPGFVGTDLEIRGLPILTVGP